MIDCSLNYGRYIIKKFAKCVEYYEKVLDIKAGEGGDLQIFKVINLKAKLFALEIIKYI